MRIILSPECRTGIARAARAVNANPILIEKALNTSARVGVLAA
jgi:hypothetical protein